MRSLAIEAWLKRKGVGWEYRDGVPLDRFDVAASLSNQARLDHPLIPEQVETLRRKVAKGIELDASIAYERATDHRLVYISGNHRHAAKCKVPRVKATDVYVVATQDPNVWRALTLEANLLNGFQQSDAENLSHAKDAVQRAGMTVKEAAATFFLSASRIEQAVRFDRTILRLSGVSGVNRLVRSVVVALGAIPNDPALTAAATLAVDCAMSQDDAYALTAEIKTARSEDAMLAVVAQWRARPDVAARIATTQCGTIGVSSKVRQQMFRLVVGLDNLVGKYPSATQLRLSIEDVASLSAHWKKLLPIMQEVLNADVTESLPAPRNGSDPQKVSAREGATIEGASVQ